MKYRAVLHSVNSGRETVNSIWVDEVNEAIKIGKIGLNLYGGTHFTIEEQVENEELYRDRLGTNEFYSGSELAEKAKDAFKEKKEFLRDFLNNENWYITDEECQKIIDSDPVKLKEINISNDIHLPKSERIANAAKILESRKNINKEGTV